MNPSLEVSFGKEDGLHPMSQILPILLIEKENHKKKNSGTVFLEHVFEVLEFWNAELLELTSGVLESLCGA